MISCKTRTSIFSYSVNSTTPGIFSNFDLRDLLYLGGHPDKEFMAGFAESKVNFEGCLQQVYYNNVSYALFVMSASYVLI